jgi:O-acetyl-ADP-ribose deacetylase (regulator of RNase III)
MSSGVVSLAEIPTWASVCAAEPSLGAPNPKALPLLSRFPSGEPALSLSRRIYLYRGDITRLRVDAIVNAANSACLGGGGIDGAIHRAAGGGLYLECKALPLLGPRTRCRTGGAVITGGHELPARHVIHTVGPQDGDPSALESCYRACYRLARRHGCASLVFNCIATGIYGFPNVKAALVALSTVEAEMRRELAGGGEGGGGGAGAEGGGAPPPLDVVFCVFLEKDFDIYEAVLSYFFPPPLPPPPPLMEEGGAGAGAGEA